MTITYPLALPTVTGFKSMTIRRNSVVGVNRSPYTGEQQVQAYPGQWWEADIVLPTLVPAKAAQWEAFLTKLNGQEGTFLAGDPVRATPQGEASSTPGTPTVDGAHSARTTTLSITGGAVSTTDYLKAGDYIQLGSGSSTRFHMVLNDLDTDASGAGDLDIWPALRDALSGGETVTVSDTKCLFRLASNEVTVDRRRGPLTFISFSAMEAL